jgi:hypothetical protein
MALTVREVTDEMWGDLVRIARFTATVFNEIVPSRPEDMRAEWLIDGTLDPVLWYKRALLEVARYATQYKSVSGEDVDHMLDSIQALGAEAEAMHSGVPYGAFIKRVA